MQAKPPKPYTSHHPNDPLEQPNHQGLRTFLTIWSGQFASLLGTGMTRFVLLIWAWQQTGQATTLALLGFFSFGPFVLVSPFAGLIVDRFDRRLVMLLADLGAGLMTLGLMAGFLTGELQVWHLFLAESLTSVFEAFQVPAYTAASTMLVPQSQYTRVSGLRSLAESASTVLAPILAGLLLGPLGLGGIMLIDVATLLIAVITLSLVRVPAPPNKFESKPQSGRVEELLVGWRYIAKRRGLLGLMLIFTGMNLFAALTYFSILPAMILARSGGSEGVLASVQGALGIGGIVGGILVSIWGGPRKKIHACLMGAALSFLLGDLLLAIGQSTPVWMIAAFAAAIFLPFVAGAQQAIWQTKVAPEVQGRVFSTKNMFQQGTRPLGFLLAGPLADQLFEPAMLPGGWLAESLGWLVGTGPGAGMGVMFLCTGIAGTLISLSGYLFRAIRQVEK